MANKPRFEGERVRLSDVCILVMGQSPSSASYNSDGMGLPFYQGNADFGDTHPIAKTWCTDPKKIAEPGDVLISVRAPIGSINVANEKCCIGRGVAAMRPHNELVSGPYLVHLLRSNRKTLEAIGTGSTFKAIGKKALSNFKVNLYSLAEQLSISKKLEQTLVCIKLGELQLSHLDNLVKSRFVEMFGDLCEGETIYPPRSIEDLCSDFLGGGTPSMKHPEYFGGEIPFIKSGDVKNRIVCEGDLSITKEGLLNSSAKLIPTGAVIVVIRSGILKHTLPVALVGCEVAINQDIKALIPASGVNSLYLQWALLVSEPLILSRVRATTADNIETKQLRKYMIPLPPLALQEEFADFVAAVDKSRFVAEYNRKV